MTLRLSAGLALLIGCASATEPMEPTPAARAWGEPVRLDADPAFGIGLAAFAMGASGDAVVAYCQADGERHDLWAVRLGRDGQWSAPALVELDDASAVWNPDVVVDADGYATLTFARQTSESYDYDLWAARSAPDGSWEPPVLLEQNASRAYPGDLAVDDQGRVWIAWFHIGEGEDGVWTSLFVPGEGFGAATHAISREVTQPLLMLDETSSPLVVFREGNEVLWSRYTQDAGWSTPVLLARQTRDEAYLSYALAASSAGDALFVSSQSGNGSDLLGHAFGGDAGWGNGRDLNGSTIVSPSSPGLAINRAGDGLVTWSEASGDTYRMRASAFDAHNGWSEAIDVFAATARGSSPRLALGPVGEAVAVWHENPFPPQPHLLTTRFMPGQGWSDMDSVRADAIAEADPLGVAFDAEGRATMFWTRTEKQVLPHGRSLWARRLE